MNELLNYICNDITRQGRDIRRLQGALRTQRRINGITALVIFAIACKLSVMNLRIKALETVTEGESD